jgi:hypothetical protein
VILLVIVFAAALQTGVGMGEQPIRLDPGAAIAFLTVGIGLLFVGVVTSVLARKTELTPSQLFWAGSQIAAHPERHVCGE